MYLDNSWSCGGEESGYAGGSETRMRNVIFPCGGDRLFDARRIRGTVLRFEEQDLLTTFALRNVSIYYRHSVLSYLVSTLVLPQVHCKST